MESLNFENIENLMKVLRLHESLDFLRPKPGLQLQTAPSSSFWQLSLGSRQAFGSPTMHASITLPEGKRKKNPRSHQRSK